MTDTPLAFGYVRVNGPDDKRLDRLRSELFYFCRHRGWGLVNVFHDYDPEQADTGWLGFAQLLNAVSQRPNSAVVVPDLTHMGLNTASHLVSTTGIAVAGATLSLMWPSRPAVAAPTPQHVAGRVRLTATRGGSEAP